MIVDIDQKQIKVPGESIEFRVNYCWQVCWESVDGGFTYGIYSSESKAREKALKEVKKENEWKKEAQRTCYEEDDWTLALFEERCANCWSDGDEDSYATDKIVVREIEIDKDIK